MVVLDFAVVADQLEAANDLADGEEAKHLGEQDARANDLGGRDIAGLAEGRGRGIGGAGGGGLQERAGVLDGAEAAVQVALEGGDGAVEGKGPRVSFFFLYNLACLLSPSVTCPASRLRRWCR